MAHDTYMELLELEEQQITLERRLQEEKKNVMRQHLIKTINDNKVKIAKKKELVAQAKAEERERMLQEQRTIEAELQQQQEDKIRKKFETRDEMVRQLKAQRKKAEDQYELDRLAQEEADKRNQAFDEKERFKTQVRGQLIKEATLGNQDILQHQRWHKEHANVQDVQEKQRTIAEHERWQQQESLQRQDEK